MRLDESLDDHRVTLDKTLSKGLRLLEVLASEERSYGISELAEQLSLGKSNVHRLLQTLGTCGYVDREPGSDRYVLSSRLWQIGRQARPFGALKRQVRPVLSRLVETTGESVLFVIVEEDELIAVDQVETQNPVRVFFTVGQSFRVDSVLMMGESLTALQVVALAERSEEEVRLAVSKVQRELKASSAFGRKQLACIADARKTGSSMSRGDWIKGANAVAVAVRDGGSSLLGVLSCFGPSDRLAEDNLNRVRQALLVAAADIEQRLFNTPTTLR